jgi:ATP-binding cassette, subfamily C (CFTR/MRP), member 1
MSLATFMGAVGSFHRIQEFLCTEVRVDDRKMPNQLDILNNRHSDYIRKHSSASEATKITEIEKSISDVTPRNGSTLSSFDAIIVSSGDFGWDREKDPLLKSIDLTIPREKLTVIVGPVGCGKSTLIKALLGEVPCMGGEVQVSSAEIGFCDQTPWHMNGTVQESIIGVSELEEVWYSTVIRACALEEDLRQLSKGDQTQIGSKGISLSGGQSQRIALARAIYSQKDIIILDDALSGLDADTENRVFHSLLGRDGLLRKHHTTVVIASSSGE